MALPRWLTKKARVPAGQHVVTMFPILHVGPVPPFDPDTWSFKVFGLVQNAIHGMIDDGAHRVKRAISSASPSRKSRVESALRGAQRICSNT